MTEPPIQGYRCWLARADDGMLRSMVVQRYWEPGQTPAATCPHAYGVPQAGPPPHEQDHNCGFHLYWRVDHLIDYVATNKQSALTGHTIVCGTVEAGGRVQHHTRGARAQYALPTGVIRVPIQDDPEHRERLLLVQYAVSELYQIPLLNLSEVT